MSTQCRCPRRRACSQTGGLGWTSDSRDESEERKREWLDPSDALERFKKWGGGVHDESKKKKAAKGDAMERALNAYASKFGWDK